ncbi:MAG: hypothetical protein JXA99_13545 [Candidatus Lokiarchaeota archaeon]|nr:hypothetical protein [Candidatus Lokiarchaeota archaeon]
MKVLIIFGTKTGITLKIANYIANILESNNIMTILHKLDKESIKNVPDLAIFDGIIIGSGIYANKWKKEIRYFVKNNNIKLKNLKLGLFISCGAGCDKLIYDFAEENYIKSLIKEYNLVPDIYGIFGSYFDLTKNSQFGYLYKKLLIHEMNKTIQEFNVPLKLEKNRTYDFINWNEIEKFANSFVELIKA